jgi:aminoglycoside phosphotransferase (APT) family kinase protein
LLPDPYLLLGYLAGRSESSPSDPHAFARALAHQLAQIHQRARGLPAACPFVPRAIDSVAQLLGEAPFACAPSFPQAAIRDVLARAWPLAERNADSLLHGDFHAGNLVWTDGVLTGVLDWADVLAGDPLADVATTRLDVLWTLDAAAMDSFTDAYFAETGFDATDLPYWDLYASLRPRANLAAWASVWPAQGRPELNEHTMSAARDEFAKRALVALGVA